MLYGLFALVRSNFSLHDRLPPTTKLKATHRELSFWYTWPQEKSTFFHTAYPLLKFALAMSEAGLNQAVLDSGFLDVLLYIYVANFVGDAGDNILVGPSDRHGFPRQDHITPCRNQLLRIGRTLLLSLSRTEDTRTVISAHPVCVLWPKDDHPMDKYIIYEKSIIERAGDHLREIYGNGISERAGIWKQLGTALVLRRIHALEVICSFDRFGLSELPEARFDVLEFYRLVLRLVLSLLTRFDHMMPTEMRHMTLKLRRERTDLRMSSKYGIS